MTSLPAEAQRFNVAIIGAGSAGCVLASRLTEDPRRSVVLVEAGRDYTADALPDDIKWGGNYHKAAYGPHDWALLAQAASGAVPMPRGRVTGGSSAINSMSMLRAMPDDYNAWAALGNDESSYERVAPLPGPSRDRSRLHRRLA